MTQVAVASDNTTSIAILDQLYGDFDQVALRVTARWDIGLLNPEGVVVLTGTLPRTNQ